MLSPEEKDVLRRVHQYVPQFMTFLENKLQDELSGLPSVAPDKVQLYQGRAKLLQELLAEFHHIAGTTANRITKPNFSTP